LDDKPKAELPDGVNVEHLSTIARGTDNKGCVVVGKANGVTKLNKHLDIKNKYVAASIGWRGSTYSDQHWRPNDPLSN
jgi:hypothetical protein